MPQLTPSTFEGFAFLGYKRTVPIIPPDAKISENSSLLKRAGKNDPRGKSPGQLYDSGTWGGYPWLKHEATTEDYQRWQRMGAGIGLKTGVMPDGRSLLLIDADTTNLECARIIRQAVEKHFGLVPARIGNDPKAGYLIACGGPFKYTRVEFGERDDKGRLIDRVEILSDGRQFVAHGVHPKTRKLYAWPRPLVPYVELPTFADHQILTFMRELEGVLPAAKELIREGGGKEVNQETLKGKIEHVRAAVAAIPNTSDNFPTREAYRDFGYAIKGALQDHPQEALELFEEWSDRWTDDVNPPGFAEAEWSRMQPPFRVGASMLYELADKIGDGSFHQADAWFDEIPDEPANDNPFAERAKIERELEKATPAEPIVWENPATWEGFEPPPREWEVPGFIPKGEVTLLYGDGGIGKTLAIQQYATAAAAGVPWLGQPTRKARVMCFFCEDAKEEIQRRQLAINKALGVTHADLDGLRIACRRFMDNLLVLWERSGEMRRQAVWEQLRKDALDFKADVVILDTLADIYAGSEIDRAQVNTFVKAALGKLMAEIGGTVIVLGHPSMAGKQSGSGTSGSTAWSNSVRSRLYMRFPEKVTKGNLRELAGMKTNYSAVGQMLKLEWKDGAFRAIGASLAATAANTNDRLDGMARPAAGVASIEEQCDDAVLAAVVSYAGQALSTSSRAARYAPKVFKSEDPDGRLEMFSLAEVEQSVARLTRRGLIRHVEVGKSAQRKPIVGYVVTLDRGVADLVDDLDAAEGEASAGVSILD